MSINEVISREGALKTEEGSKEEQGSIRVGLKAGSEKLVKFALTAVEGVGLAAKEEFV